WDSQLRSVLPSLLKKQFVKWEECSVRGCRHLELTPFGAEMLKAWNRLGCRAHSGWAENCGKHRARSLLPVLQHEAA
ncbi:MAG: hypothetical protein RB191_24915, partial [Terriglobia bacterium]|nr:hypothetical protein [Terriglobia bacterium]